MFCLRLVKDLHDLSWILSNHEVIILNKRQIGTQGRGKMYIKFSGMNELLKKFVVANSGDLNVRKNRLKSC